MKPHCSYNLCTCVIPSAMFFIFCFLIILPVTNMMCRDMVFRKVIPFIFVRQQRMVSFFYLSGMVLGILVILTSSTYLILRRSVLPFSYSMLGLYISSAIRTSSHRIERFCRILLSTACKFCFIGLPVMCWNLPTQSSVFMLWSVYLLLLF